MDCLVTHAHIYEMTAPAELLNNSDLRWQTQTLHKVRRGKTDFFNEERRKAIAYKKLVSTCPVYIHYYTVD